MKTATITAFALFALAAATGCSATAESVRPTVANRECSAPGAYVVSPPTVQRGFDPTLSDSTVQTVGTAQLEGRGVPADTSRGVAVRTAADTSARGGPRYCF
jgi:hypothetical protein